MRKKPRHQMYSKPEKSKVMKMKANFHDMDDMCDMEDMVDELDDMVCEPGMEKELCTNFPACIQFAHDYVPWQTYEKAFTPPEALMKGTLFPELWGVYRIPK